MSKNLALIRTGLRMLAQAEESIKSGIVVAGSYDDTERTVSVIPAGKTEAIQHVLLSGICNEDTGIVLVPKGGSDVVIGCVDGAGVWTVLKYGELEEARIELGNVICEISADICRISKGSTVLETGSTIKVSTATENLASLLGDLIAAIKLITVATPSGTSGVPLNVSAFEAINARITNLLSS